MALTAGNDGESVEGDEAQLRTTMRIRLATVESEIRAAHHRLRALLAERALLVHVVRTVPELWDAGRDLPTEIQYILPSGEFVCISGLQEEVT